MTEAVPYGGAFLTFIEWGCWEAARLPWEKDVGEIPQGCKSEEACHFPHRKASSFPTTPDS